MTVRTASREEGSDSEGRTQEDWAGGWDRAAARRGAPGPPEVGKAEAGPGPGASGDGEWPLSALMADSGSEVQEVRSCLSASKCKVIYDGSHRKSTQQLDAKPVPL